MHPDELCKKGTESGHQKALFAWAAMACYKGFRAANDPRCYTAAGATDRLLTPVPELKWLHAIPNGGARDARTAAMLKGEGVRRGVADVCLPVARKGCHGLYIEMKKPGESATSPEQKEFGAFVTAQGYHWQICTGWREAATLIEKYLT